MSFMNTINKKFELVVPIWLAAFFLIEWIFNSNLDYRPFIGGFILLLGVIQSSPQEKLIRWANYTFRTILIAAIIIVLHPKEFWAAMAKLGV